MTNNLATTHPTGVAALPRGAHVNVEGFGRATVITPANGCRSMVVRLVCTGRSRIVDIDRVSAA